MLRALGARPQASSRKCRPTCDRAIRLVFGESRHGLGLTPALLPAILACHSAAECKGPSGHPEAWACAPGQLLPLALQQGVLVAHGLGGIDGLDKTNTREALHESLAEGKVWYEVDVARSADDVLICAHPSRFDELSCESRDDDLAALEDVTAEEFVARRYDSRFIPIVFEEVLHVMEGHPEIQVILDTQEFDANWLTLLVELAELHPGTGERLVPQLYRPDDAYLFGAVRDRWAYPFEILTLYQWTDDTALAIDALPFLPRVRMVTMWGHLVDRDTSRAIHARGVLVGAHTVNDLDEAATLAAKGADVFYTDTLCGPCLP